MTVLSRLSWGESLIDDCVGGYFMDDRVLLGLLNIMLNMGGHRQNSTGTDPASTLLCWNDSQDNALLYILGKYCD